MYFSHINSKIDFFTEKKNKVTLADVSTLYDIL